MSFLTVPFPIPSLVPLKGEWVSSCAVPICRLGLNHKVWTACHLCQRCLNTSTPYDVSCSRSTQVNPSKVLLLLSAAESTSHPLKKNKPNQTNPQPNAQSVKNGTATQIHYYLLHAAGEQEHHLENWFTTDWQLLNNMYFLKHRSLWG